MTDDMKKFLILAAAALLAGSCGLKTVTYSDEQATPLAEGQADSLIQSISIEYPVKGAQEDILAKIEDGILNAAFDMEELPGSVEETALRYEDNLKDLYFNEYEGMEGEGEQEEVPVSEAQTAFEPGMKEANDDTLME